MDDETFRNSRQHAPGSSRAGLHTPSSGPEDDAEMDDRAAASKKPTKGDVRPNHGDMEIHDASGDPSLEDGGTKHTLDGASLNNGSLEMSEELEVTYCLLVSTNKNPKT